MENLSWKLKNLLAKEKSLGVFTPRSAPDSFKNQRHLPLSPYTPRTLYSWPDFVQQAEIDERQTAGKSFALVAEGRGENKLHFQFPFFFFPLIFPATSSETLKISLLFTLPLHFCFLIKAILFFCFLGQGNHVQRNATHADESCHRKFSRRFPWPQPQPQPAAMRNKFVCSLQY